MQQTSFFFSFHSKTCSLNDFYAINFILLDVFMVHNKHLHAKKCHNAMMAPWSILMVMTSQPTFFLAHVIATFDDDDNVGWLLFVLALYLVPYHCKH